MAEFKISRIRYTWKGTWSTSTDYQKDDVVRFGGSTFVCIRKHTATEFNDDLTFIPVGDTIAQPAWIKMSDGYQWRNAWESGVLYSPGDIVLFGGAVYLAVESHTASDLNDDIANWTIYAASSKWNNIWESSKAYGLYDIVRYNGTVYRCISGHTSGGDLESDQNKWQIVYAGIEFRGSWTISTRYAVNDLVKYGASIFRCITGHTSTSEFDNDVWNIEFPGQEFGGEWDLSTVYQIGDVVRHGGFLYYALTNNTASNPADSTLPIGSNDWAKLSNAINPRGDWEITGSYKTGDLVRIGGNLYIAKQDSLGDGSSLTYLDSGNWELVVPGTNWKNYWQEDTVYLINDVVLFDGSAYICTFGHESSLENYPGDNGNGLDYWDVLLLAAEGTGMTQQGDLITFGLSRRRTGDGSTFDVTDVPIGNSEELLVVQENDALGYKVWGNKQRHFYVEPNGVDDEFDPDRGINPFKPYKTIRFACEKADDGFTGTTTVYAQAGEYKEILPIIVPVRTAIKGHEERTTTIKPNDPIPELASDINYTISAVNRIAGLIPALAAANTVSKSSGNTEDQVQLFDEISSSNENGELIITQVPVVASLESVEQVQLLAGVFISYITFYISGEGEEPAMEGTNTITTDEGVLTLIRILEANREFLASEAAAWTRAQSPNYPFSEEACKRDARRYVDAFIYDIKYPGTYKTIYAGRYYKNAVLGSKTEDMFYVRDASGVRHLTVDGLEGTLNPVGVFDLYRRPTGGSYVSLDPGWGPDDDRCWITTRSPYIQGLATFGYAAIGQKIDGSLHNGGNKSIVSNDFTQIISDGIGAWVLNNGRAELVSVFTYYAQVGYLATDGGVIRATNGNCSYGNYGAYATGVDPSEVPGTAVVDNRNQEAIVRSAFAGEVNDEILILEYTNAGQGYTEATTSFTGAGVNAEVVNDEFRDNGVFNVRLVNPLDSGFPGGSGFVQAGNNAQAGNLTTITLATNEELTPSQIAGLRIIITSGTGTGQYAYADSYNDISKILNVRRESDGEIGWDHVIPGYPIAPVLDTSTTYRIEPRPIFSEPGFTSSAVDLEAGTEWSNIVYGETTASYTGVVSQLGTGSVIEDDGLSATAATFNVTKNGRDYTVTLNNAGAGYNVRDEITILGTDLGGITPDNDINITVTGTTDDSTNSITSFAYDGQGATGRFVAVPAVGRITTHSLDGENWSVESTGLPRSGNWKCLAAGGNRFVAIRNGSADAAYSTDGINWSLSSMPSSANWNAVVYGEQDGIFVAVAGDADKAAISSDGGETWTASTITNIGDSTFQEWVGIAYGKNKFVAVANSNNVAVDGVYDSDSNTITWTTHIMDVIDDSSQKDWVNLAYGNNRFVAISSQADVSYSFDGITWYGAQMPKPDDSSIMNWNNIKYGQGIFFAVCDTGDNAVVSGDAADGPTRYCATSPDGIVWTNRFLTTEAEWGNLAFGNPDISVGDSTPQNNTGMWITIPKGVSDTANRIFTGARALGRIIVAAGRVSEVRIWEPGSGYSVSPTLTVIDPNNTSELFVDARIGESVLAQPSWVNRGQGFRTSSTIVTINGDGFADIIEIGTNITLDKLDSYPGPGTQLVFDGIDEVYTVVTIEELGQNLDGTFKARFRIDPSWDNNAGVIVEHGTSLILRRRYSQCRISSHDFLDIGTGNFVETNYPEVYADGRFFTAAPENEVTETDGGRVFYTSSDQDGNFRCGELFAVEQATGIVTISAEFFDLDGLSELRLGGIRVGGSGVVIREFSTDPLFTEDSNNVVPTQRAISTFLQNRLSVGGSELSTASFTAGTVKVGPTEISSTISGRIDIPGPTDFSAGGETLENDPGTTQGQVQGYILGQRFFYRSFSDDPLRTS